MTRPLILADLDDTLFQTRGKCGDWPAAALKPMSWLADGSPSGFANPRQRALLEWLRHGEMVPVTARSREVLARVELEQAPAICANGGCIIGADGEPDHEWHAQLAAQSAGGVAPSQLHRDFTADLSPELFRHWVAAEDGHDLYVVIKSNLPDLSGLEALAAELTPRLPDGWRTHANGNNLAFLPPWLGKRQATAYWLERVRAETPERLVVGIADSHSDAGFLDLTDIAMLPTASQLWVELAAGNEWID
jgi:hypothetical protein